MGEEDEAIAALLHDALEDAPHRITAEDIERRFGSRVRAVVEACTDTEPGFAGGEKAEWRSRKEAYIRKVRSVHGNHRVSLADKVHNIRCILRDYRADGEALWGRFKGGRDGTLWYYLELAKAYRAAGAEEDLLQELEESVQQLRRNVHELEGGAHEPGDPAQGS
jgi:(p)ppGpp synthase/HD superfamily hydrolase